ncbi:NADH-quinone oxidoreductase subunit NuoK [Fervidibacillus halotolerans]|uniref:NADH-quinone oxidoreductase subunit K n=1 Tax=Fervidibacillus halotolerans TaxID=2980027 RepID=A0A9E8RXU2_9BACI|nr:NADH-quinone oxidoreductase subunit NuoK [Fervidibacillus halotolerans]WAA12166.1 NADH-quinone oxidoreductase subunit NuoK [Fervidibacillus halotolerans]
MVSLSAYLTVALIVFCIGLFGALSHKNTLIVFLSIELMLNAVNLNFIAFTKYGFFPNISGQVIALFVMTVAALEVAIGLAILLTLYRNKKTIDLDEIY